MSSGSSKFDLRAMAPGGLLVVGHVVDEATMEDPDQAIAEVA
jgi:hypothetical protein